MRLAILTGGGWWLVTGDWAANANTLSPGDLSPASLCHPPQFITLWFQHFNSPLRCWPPGAAWHGDWWGAGGEAETSTPAADHTRLQHSLQHCRYSARTIGTDVYWISLVMFAVLGLSAQTNKFISEMRIERRRCLFGNIFKDHNFFGYFSASEWIDSLVE